MVVRDHIRLEDLKEDRRFDFLAKFESTNNHSQVDDDNYDYYQGIDDLPYSTSDLKCKYLDEIEFSKEYSKSKKISFLSLNIQSLPSKFNEFVEFLSGLGSDGGFFDVIAVQETWQLPNTDMFMLDGYNSFFKTRNNNVQGGGVGLYVKDTIKATVIPELSVFTEKVFESIFVHLELPSGKKIIVSSIYRPNSKHPRLSPNDQFDHSMDIFSNILSQLSEKKLESYLLGDFNIDLLKYDSHIKTNEYINNMFAFGFLQLITRPTRCIHGSVSLIDHLITNAIKDEYISGIITSRLSDHFPIFHFISDIKPKVMPKFIKIRDYSQANMKVFKAELKKINWNTVLQNNCAQESYNIFSDELNFLHQLYFPIKEIRFNKNIHAIEPWITSGILTSRRNKMSLCKLSIATPSPENIKHYKDYRNLYNKVVRASRKQYYEKILKKNQTNLKNTWNILKHACKKSNKKSNVIDKININGVLIDNQSFIAEHFNDFFTSIAQKTVQQVIPTDKPPDEYITTINDLEFIITPTFPSEVIEVVDSMKSKNSTDSNDLSVKFLKNIIWQIAIPLVHIFNLSFESGVFPDNLKMSKVVPVFKNGDRTQIANYRPISIVPAIGKILEKIMANKLTSYLENNNLLHNNQFGFRKKHSTIHPVIHLLNKISEALDKKEFLIAIFIDLQRAFDTVSLPILLKKLHKYGIKNSALDWFKSFLSDRKQFVKIGDSSSTVKSNLRGVPQGSTLGPILFLIYINDLPEASNLLSLLFADDTTLVASGKDLPILINFINQELHKVCLWLRANELCLHPEKCVFTVFSRSEKNIPWDDLNIFLNNNDMNKPEAKELMKKIAYVNSNSDVPAIKFLGIFFDPSLNFKHHINSLHGKITRALYSIKMLKHFLSPKALKSLYFALIHSHLIYGIQAWSCASKATLSKLIQKQKQAIRVISGANYNSHTEPLFKIQRILPLEKMIVFSQLQFFHDFCYKFLPLSFNSTWIKNSERPDYPVNLRNVNDYYIPSGQCSISQNLPLANLPKVWNLFNSIEEEEVKFIRDTKKFNSKLKEYYLNKLSGAISCTRLLCPVCHLQL